MALKDKKNVNKHERAVCWLLCSPCMNETGVVIPQNLLTFSDEF